LEGEDMKKLMLAVLAGLLLAVPAMAADAPAGGLALKLPVWWGLVLPFLSPVLIGVLKMLLPMLKERVPAMAWPVVSAVLTALLTALGVTVDPVTLGLAAVAGLGGAKARDLAVGKPAACDPLDTGRDR
jgi:hypothetical protein